MTPTDKTAVLLTPTPPPLPPVLSALDNLTTRDVFAAFALQGVIAAHVGDGVDLPSSGDAAKWCREYADALLTELSTTPFPG
jgi:hypothetical protein